MTDRKSEFFSEITAYGGAIFFLSDLISVPMQAGQSNVNLLMCLILAKKIESAIWGIKAE